MKVLAISSGGAYVDLPDPAYCGYTALPNEVVKAGTNTSGLLYKDRIRIRYTITVSWTAISPEQKNLILRLTSGNDFNIRYFDVTDGTTRYGKFYRGNDLAVNPVLRYNGSEFEAYNIDMSLVEF